MHAPRRVVLAAVVLSAGLAAAPASAQTSPSGSGRAIGDRTRAGADVAASSGTAAGGGVVAPASNSSGSSHSGGGGERCFMIPYLPGTGPAAEADEMVYQRICPSSSGLTSFELGGEVTVGPPAPGGGPAPVVIDPAVLAEQARDSLILATPVVRLSPTGDQIAQLASWLWLDSGWAEQSASASAGPVTSTVTATPKRVRWAMGNGDEVSCAGPGKPYEPRFAGTPAATNCSYTYQHSSAGEPGDTYPVTATVEYALTWTAVGAPGGGDLGLAEQSTTVPVRVSELQALVQ